MISRMTKTTTCAPMLRLQGHGGPSGRRDFELDRDVTVLGRDPSCDIVLTPVNVSRRHARIIRRLDGYYLEDLGSTGGTLVNDQAVSGSIRLREGDRIKIGGCTLMFTTTTRLDRANEAEDAAILGLRDVSGTAERELAGIRSEEKLRALLEIGKDLVGSHDLKDVLARTLDALFRIFSKAERGFVLLRKEGANGLVPRAMKVRGSTPGRLTISRTIFEHVVLHGQAVLSGDVTTDDRFGGARSVDEAQIRSLMCVPLKDHLHQTVGILQLDTLDRQSRFTPDDLDILVAVAGQVSVAVDNARLLEMAGQERRRLAFLAEAGAAFASSLDLPATLAAVARLAVPELADLCLVDLRDESGAIRCVAAAHAEPTKQTLVDELRRRYPLDPEGPHPAMKVFRSNRPELANSVSDQLLEAIATDNEHLDLLRRLGFTSYIAVPLVARGRTLGVVSLIGTETDRRYGPADLELAEELARRAAMAIDNAVLYHEAQDARRRAEEAGRSKDLFLAMLSHELRTPLTPILAVVSASLEQGPDPELRPALEMIRRNVALEARLIDDLLDLSRIERGRLRLDREVVDVHRTIQQALEICRDEIFVAGLEVITDLSAVDYHAEADQARLMQIGWNLIRNAAKFTPAGGTLTIRTRNIPSADPDAPPALVVEFEDTGQGIEPEVMPRIFDAFEQGQADLRCRSGGLGLGLAISRSLAEAHGGSLTAHSPGKGFGSTFRLTLSAVLERAPKPEATPLPSLSQPCCAQRILLVEDNRDTLQFLALILGQRGHTVYKAANLAEARAEASSKEFDLLISDIELPDGTGLELMHELASRHIKGIAMSGFGSEDDVRQSRDAGFQVHLTKPVDLGKLEKEIRAIFHC
jgi:signal transduction histidine kinase